MNKRYLKFRIVLQIFFLLGIFTQSRAQVVSLNGYLKDMQGVFFLEHSIPNPSGEQTKTLGYNLIHNRLNFKAYPFSNLSMALEIRNRLFSGKLLKYLPSYADYIAIDDGLVDLSWNLVNKENYFINTSIDRFYIDYTIGSVQVRAGRQRINWGVNLVWNPNDIFNAFSYMDFDYEERPGSDAILLTWYPSLSSSFDIAYKTADSIINRAYAAKYRFNAYNYDFQILAGTAAYDYVIGGGWTGNIQSVGFRGEASWFKPMNEYKNLSDEGISASVSLDISLPNSLYFQTSFLYNSLGGNNESFSLIDPTLQLSAKKLSMGKYELFGQVSYPIGSLFNISASGMLNPDDLSMFIAPALSVSLHDDLELFLTSQVMLGDEGTEYAAMGNFYALFGRLRWSF